MKLPAVNVIGFGAWGGALSIHMARHGVKKITAWEFMDDLRQTIQQKGVHPSLGNHGQVPNTIRLMERLEDCCREPGSVIFLAVASSAAAAVLEKLKSLPRPGACLIVSKGLEPGTLSPLHLLVKRHLGLSADRIFVLAGPTIAKELIEGGPTLAVLAGPSGKWRTAVQKLLARGNLSLRFSNDVTGVQVGAAMKNIYALGYGILEGIQASANSRSIYLMQAMEEMARTAQILGGLKETVWGPAGLGDLLTTSLSKNSRNSGLGRLLAQGLSLAEAQKRIGMVTEGVEACRQFSALASRRKLHLPLLRRISTLLISPSKNPELLVRLK